MRAHTTVGGRILEPIARFADLIPIVVHHHERWDGGGYPQHLAGEGVPLLARVLAFADVYDALTSDRPYRASLTHERALAMIEAGLGTQFDPRIGRVFLDMMGESEPEGTLRPPPLSAARLVAAAARS
jgi:HD-GYP domain-containing protein (c-di-GMP phosphodiesterase class II)